MKIDEIVEKNFELQHKLNEEHTIYYEELILYVRTQAVFSNEYTCEYTLFQVLQEMLSLQEKEQNAQLYYEKTSRELGEDILRSLPRMHIAEGLGSFTFMSSVIFILEVIRSLTERIGKIDVGSILLSILFLCIWYGLFFQHLGKKAYDMEETIAHYNRKALLFLILGFVTSVCISVYVDTPITISLFSFSGTIVCFLSLIFHVVIYTYYRLMTA